MHCGVCVTELSNAVVFDNVIVHLQSDLHEGSGGDFHFGVIW